MRVRVRACAVNRADLLQRMGFYPAPPGAPRDIPGLEIAGEIDALGSGSTEFAIGDRVFGLVGGGAYAEAVIVHERTLARIPDALDFAQAAACPRRSSPPTTRWCCRAASAPATRARARRGQRRRHRRRADRARHRRALVGTARTEDKLDARGARHDDGRRPRTARRRARVRGAGERAGEAQGVDVVLELVGGATSRRASLRSPSRPHRARRPHRGRRADIDLGMVLRRRLRVMGTVLRARPLEEKILAAQVLDHASLRSSRPGTLAPSSIACFPLEQAAEAHAYDRRQRGLREDRPHDLVTRVA